MQKEKVPSGYESTIYVSKAIPILVFRDVRKHWITPMNPLSPFPFPNTWCLLYSMAPLSLQNFFPSISFGLYFSEPDENSREVFSSDCKPQFLQGDLHQAHMTSKWMIQDWQQTFSPSYLLCRTSSLVRPSISPYTHGDPCFHLLLQELLCCPDGFHGDILAVETLMINQQGSKGHH